jgi:hypothetical protein
VHSCRDALLGIEHFVFAMGRLLLDKIARVWKNKRVKCYYSAAVLRLNTGS